MGTITKKVTYISEEGFEFKFEPIESSLTITETKEGYEARYLINDDNADDPRNWDNLGKMLCFHKRYNLGDKHTETSEQFNGWDEIEEYLRKEKKAVVILPLYLYDHSGISIRTYRHGQYASWDGGQVGFVYITKEQLKKEGLTKKRAEEVIIAEVETYNKYVQGDCYCLVKETYTKDKEHIDYDTLGGFYGYDDAIEALKTEI